MAEPASEVQGVDPGQIVNCGNDGVEHPLSPVDMMTPVSNGPRVERPTKQNRANHPAKLINLIDEVCDDLESSAGNREKTLDAVLRVNVVLDNLLRRVSGGR